MITFSEKAGKKMQEALVKQGKSGCGIRISVVGGGCSGMQYQMNFEDSPETNDLTFSANGVRIFVDPGSILYLEGTQVDYEETIYGGAFTFRNPNARESCGCGHSFSA